MRQAAYHILDGRFWLTAVPAWGRLTHTIEKSDYENLVQMNHTCNKIKHADEAVAEFFLYAVKFKPLNKGRQDTVKPAFTHHAPYTCTVSDPKMSARSMIIDRATHG